MADRQGAAAGPAGRGGGLPGDGVHGHGRTTGVRSWPAHDQAEAVQGWKARADLLFVSPIHPTRSHPGAPSLGPARAARIGRELGLPRIALGEWMPRGSGRCADAFTAGRRSMLGFAGLDPIAEPSSPSPMV
ncbi:thiamine phosphate synthase [Sphingomonas sp. I4]